MEYIETPDKLPCVVVLDSVMKFGKGMSTKVMLETLNVLGNLTAEERAEHDESMRGTAEFISVSHKHDIGTQGMLELNELLGIKSDISAILHLLEHREWAEHCTKTSLGKRLEVEITGLYNLLADKAAKECIKD